MFKKVDEYITNALLETLYCEAAILKKHHIDKGGLMSRMMYNRDRGVKICCKLIEYMILNL